MDWEVHGTNCYYPGSILCWKMRTGWNDKMPWAVKLHGWREQFAIRWRPRATAWASVRPCGSLEILACDFRQQRILLRCSGALQNTPQENSSEQSCSKVGNQLFFLLPTQMPWDTMDSSSGAARWAGVLLSPGLTPGPLGRYGWRRVVLTPFWGKPPNFFLWVPPRHPRGGSSSSEETTRGGRGRPHPPSPSILSGGTRSRRLGKHATRSEGRCARRRRAAHA